MKVLYQTILVVFALVTSVICAQPTEERSAKTEQEDWVYLDSGVLRLGVIRSSGGAIAFLAPSGSPRNLLNHYDRGRYVQQSYYGDSDGSFWGKRPWRYNPVQGGDYRGKSPPLLELRSEGSSLYCRSIPLHWATGKELRECVMEQWVSLEGSIVHARFQFTYSGTVTHAAHHQEIPAIFVDASLATLVSYTGSEPWTNGQLTRRIPGATNEYITITEHWVAYVDEKDFGIGVYVPIASEATCYRYLGGSGSDCSYVAPINTFALKPGLTFTYDAYFAVGSVEQLRKQFYTIYKTTKQK
jgi:hypothetical protein